MLNLCIITEEMRCLDEELQWHKSIMSLLLHTQAIHTHKRAVSEEQHSRRGDEGRHDRPGGEDDGGHQRHAPPAELVLEGS